jgi:peroxiredoxin
MDAPPTETTPAPNPSGALALTSLIFGILAVALSFLVLGLLLGLIGLIFAWVHLSRKAGHKGMARWGLGLSIFGVIASIGFAALYYAFYQKISTAMQAGAGADFASWEGVSAPDISVATLDGKTIKLSELKGKRVVLDFWATWCPPCVKEIPHYVRLYGETSRDDLAIVGISDETPETLKAFVSKNGVNYPIARAATNLPPPFDKITSIPTTFFIDRHGVIQTVAVGYNDYAALKSDAMAADVAGAPKSAPAPPASLAEGPQTMHLTAVWSASIPGAQAMCVGDWENDGGARVLVAAGSTLHVLDLEGTEKSTAPLPDRFTAIECGHGKTDGARLLGYGNWGQVVEVIDHSGKEVWNFTAGFGADGAHWGDLDGDGDDELIVGMNGFGGLQALSSDGKKLWSASLGNVWNQAVVPATAHRAARVFATEAGGSVRVFDGAGRALATLHPDGLYIAQMTARAIDDKSIQIIGVGESSTVAFDESGKIAWKTSASANAGGWISHKLAAGNLRGDGTTEWVFIDGSGDLVVASTAGEKIGSIAHQNGLDEFVVAPRPGKAGLLVVRKGGVITAYQLEP